MHDFYDDPQGAVLKEKLGQQGLQELLKHGHILSGNERAELPDYLFSLVMTTNNGPMRKYARNDLVNTVVSSVYFLEGWRDLPVAVVKTAASNLLEACDWYDLEVPPQLKKLASGPMGLGALGVGMSIPWLQDIGARGQKKQQQILRAAGVPPTPAFVENPDILLQRPKKAGSPYVDVREQDFKAADAIDLDLSSVVQQSIKLGSLSDFYHAISHWREHSWDWTPEEKVAYSRPLAKFASQIGKSPDLPDEIRQYGNTKTAASSYMASVLETREPYFADPRDYVEYLTKVAEISDNNQADQLAQKLAALERDLFLSENWGPGMPDPWLAVYGMYKQADYTFKDGGLAITEVELRQLAAEAKERLKERFDDEFVNAFASDPVAIFASMPLDHKRLIIKIKQGK